MTSKTQLKPQGQSASGRGVLTNLQLCRAYAALVVVVGHTLHDFEAFGANANDPNAWPINWGAGVDIFFVISGFIMVHVAADDFGKAGSSWRFFSRRVARVAPLYWMATTALILGAFIAPGLLNVPIGDWRHVVASYAFIPDPRPGLEIIRPVLALGWTLNFEMLFYVVFALAMLLPLRLGLPWSALCSRSPPSLTSPSRRPIPALRSGPIRSRSNSYLARRLARAAYRFRCALGAKRTAFALAALGLGLATVDVATLLQAPATANVIRFGLPAALAVGGACFGTQLTRGVFTRWGLAIGDASYALYLSHPFVIRPLRKLWQSALNGHANALFPVMATLMCVAVALALHRWLEKPMTRALVRRLEGAPPPRADVAAAEPVKRLRAA